MPELERFVLHRLVELGGEVREAYGNYDYKRVVALLTDPARNAVELCRLVRPRTAIPIHYEGWKHFQQDRERVERDFASAPHQTSIRSWNCVARTIVHGMPPATTRRSASSLCR